MAGSCIWLWKFCLRFFCMSDLHMLCSLRKSRSSVVTAIEVLSRKLLCRSRFLNRSSLCSRMKKLVAVALEVHSPACPVSSLVATSLIPEAILFLHSKKGKVCSCACVLLWRHGAPMCLSPASNGSTMISSTSGLHQEKTALLSTVYRTCQIYDSY